MTKAGKKKKKRGGRGGKRKMELQILSWIEGSAVFTQHLFFQISEKICNTHINIFV